MPDFQFTFIVPNISANRADTLRGRLEERMREDGATPVLVSVSRTTESWRVIGVDVATRQVFDETVEAHDRDSAEQAVVGSVTTRVVAVSRRAGAGVGT